jgi:TfoX/Sxy family transcriptional regulator of competence genes
MDVPLLADRIRTILGSKTDFEEKKMFGGLCYMVQDKMCVGITNKGEFMARIDPARESEAIEKLGCREMDFTGRKMKGFILVDASGTETKSQLSYYIDLAMEYNRIAKKSKPKKK